MTGRPDFRLSVSHPADVRVSVGAIFPLSFSMNLRTRKKILLLQNF